MEHLDVTNDTTSRINDVTSRINDVTNDVANYLENKNKIKEIKERQRLQGIINFPRKNKIPIPKKFSKIPRITKNFVHYAISDLLEERETPNDGRLPDNLYLCSGTITDRADFSTLEKCPPFYLSIQTWSDRPEKSRIPDPDDDAYSENYYKCHITSDRSILTAKSLSQEMIFKNAMGMGLVIMSVLDNNRNQDFTFILDSSGPSKFLDKTKQKYDQKILANFNTHNFQYNQHRLNIMIQNILNYFENRLVFENI